MYTPSKPTKTTITVNTSKEGETIEQKMRRIVNNGEPIKDGAPLIYTDRAKGVKPELDIRTDRMEIAVDIADKISRTRVAQREERIKGRTKPDAEKSTTTTESKG